jgi:hypothetical protein
MHCSSGSAKEKSCGSGSTTLLTITSTSVHYHEENLRVLVGVAGLPEVFVFYFMLDGSKSVSGTGSGTGLHCGSCSAPLRKKVAVPVPLSKFERLVSGVAGVPEVQGPGGGQEDGAAAGVQHQAELQRPHRDPQPRLQAPAQQASRPAEDADKRYAGTEFRETLPLRILHITCFGSPRLRPGRPKWLIKMKKK